MSLNDSQAKTAQHPIAELQAAAHPPPSEQDLFGECLLNGRYSTPSIQAKISWANRGNTVRALR